MINLLSSTNINPNNLDPKLKEYLYIEIYLLQNKQKPTLKSVLLDCYKPNDMYTGLGSNWSRMIL